MSAPPGGGRPPVAIAHDFLTQLGGGERTVLAMAAAFPGATIHTALYDPGATYAEFAALDVRTSVLDRIGPLRRHHRMALPVLAHSFSLQSIDAEVVLCSSAGWAHGVGTTGAKVVYCYTPARWLYGAGRYVSGGGMGRAALAARLLAQPMRRWDQAAAASAQRYLVPSSMIRNMVSDLYGIEAEVLAPPVLLGPGEEDPLDDEDQPFHLCVCRLLPYKNVGAVVDAFGRLPDRRLLVVGAGPYREEIEAGAPTNVRFLGSVSDARLRWLYRHCTAVVSASFEDFGLTPLEGAGFSRPAVVLRWGGFRDTVVDGVTGVFFDQPEPAAIANAVDRLERAELSPSVISAHAERFTPAAFAARLRDVVDEVRPAR